MDSSSPYRAVLRNRLETGWRPRVACLAPKLEWDGCINSRVIVVLQRLHWPHHWIYLHSESSHLGILQCCDYSSIVIILLIWTRSSALESSQVKVLPSNKFPYYTSRNIASEIIDVWYAIFISETIKHITESVYWYLKEKTLLYAFSFRDNEYQIYI